MNKEDIKTDDLKNVVNDTLIWGKSVWVIEGVESTEPTAKPSDPFHDYICLIRLIPLECQTYFPDELTQQWFLQGDSNYRMMHDDPAHEISMVIGVKSFDLTT